MRLVTMLAVAVCLPVAALAEDSVPDLKGTWTGQFRSLVYGTNAYHPGTATVADPPRVREITTTVVVEGQDGRLVWGKARVGDGPGDPFAWAIGADGKTVIGSDIDGTHMMTIAGPDMIERCYTHSGLSPSKSIVATCGTLTRVKN